MTYRFAIRSNFDSTKWIAEQRASIAEQSEANEPQLEEASTGLTEFWHMVDFPIGEYRHTIYGGGRAGNECESYLLRMLRTEILDALRDAERELVDGGEQRLLYRVLRQSSQSRYVDVKRLLSELKQAIDVEPSLQEIRTDVESLLRSVSLETPGESHAIGLQFVAPEATELLKKIGMTYGANPLSVARNGLGRNNLLYIALLLSQLSKTCDPAVADDAFVCFRFVGIEEPEAHLHPHLQDHLARNIVELREKHCDLIQLVLTSHSTHIAAKLDLANTAILFRDETDGQLHVHYVLSGLDPKQDKASIRFLSLYLDATKSQMFFARRLILVEGIAEQTIVPALFEQQEGRSLESIGCTVLNVNGVAFRHFLTVIQNGYFRKCAVLTDRDTGTNTEDRAERLRADFSAVSHIQVQSTTESTFEKELILANSAGDSRDLLFSALSMVKPSNGPKLKEATGTSNIDVDRFFSEIVNHKAEFAFALASILRSEPANALQEKRAARKIVIPPYISAAFEFLKG